MTSRSLIKSIKAIQHSWGQRRTGTVPPCSTLTSNLEPMGIGLKCIGLCGYILFWKLCRDLYSPEASMWIAIFNLFFSAHDRHTLNFLSVSWPWCEFLLNDLCWSSVMIISATLSLLHWWVSPVHPSISTLLILPVSLNQLMFCCHCVFHIYYFLNSPVVVFIQFVFVLLYKL